MNERWKPIKGFQKEYEVSTRGRFKSVRRYITFTRNGRDFTRVVPSCILSPFPSDGYLQVSLKGKTYLTHRLVAEAFIPNPDNLPEVNHKDLNKKNNRVGNLEWVTGSGNVIHAISKGVKFNPNPRKGEHHHNSKLTVQQVTQLRRLHQKGYSQRWLSHKFKVSRGSVRCIISGASWSHVKWVRNGEACTWAAKA